MLHFYVTKLLSFYRYSLISSSISSGRRSHQMAISEHLYRDKIYIIKDIILKLVEYGQLNPTSLISFCGLNFKKHTPILHKMELKGLISKSHIVIGRRPMTAYKPTQKGIEFCKRILEPYEIMFPRKDSVREEALDLIFV
jgi:predicted transcriptional regulator